MTKSERIALGLEYDGRGFKGWQSQRTPGIATVQETLERALAEIADHEVKVACAGRTDTGVHATAQVVHFDTPSQRPLKAWVRGGNTLLPDTVAIRWARVVDEKFHARFAALSRRYRYVIHNLPVQSALLRDLVTTHPYPLEAEPMASAGRYLLGEHDFSAFRGAGCQSATPMRNLTRLDVWRKGDFILVDVQANAFLQHMVRNIIGVLLPIGEGRREPEWAREVLESRDRTLAGITAPPQGLHLVQVAYPEHFGLPLEEPAIPFLQT